MLSNPEQDAAQIQLQEASLALAHFDASTAWTLGTLVRGLATARSHALVVDIRRFGKPCQPLFYTALPETTPDNARWVGRKANVVARFHRSSYAVGIGLQSFGQTLTDRHALSARLTPR